MLTLELRSSIDNPFEKDLVNMSVSFGLLDADEYALSLLVELHECASATAEYTAIVVHFDFMTVAARNQSDDMF